MVNCSMLAARTEKSRLSSGAVIGMVLGLVTLLLLIYAVAWLVYAFYHPDTRSGTWLLEVCSYIQSAVTGHCKEQQQCD